MDTDPPDGTAQFEAQRFESLWQANAGRVHAYAMRHVDPHTAQEVVAETFLVAWRRLADVPGEPLPWLLVVAKNTIANQRRSLYRKRAVELELARIAHLAPPADGADVTAGERTRVLTALAYLDARDREALLLTAWDGLSAAAAAEVAGCSPEAFRVRLSRARRRLTQSANDDEPPGRPTARSLDPAAIPFRSRP
ncbi:RNA polymerase sigma factor [Cellulomonas fimi]|uniref:RNA polymerase sigma factor n=1 Tax=Cellulomonas fimi TaxID=1708 RepID=UPI000F832EAC|nr:sigma-70 family RNA polymerase sigma factor [Cellulomonas fimi]NNH06695.1 sigma-70 family RNA polymerase sigma factor [Cellulomonas fimi]